METDDRPVGCHLSCGDPRHGKRNGRIELHPQFPDDRESCHRSASFHVMDPRGRTILSASSTLHEWAAWTRLSCVGFRRSSEVGEYWHGNTHDLPLPMDRCECVAVSKAFLSDSSRTVGRDGDPSPSMWNYSTIGEQHGRLRVTDPTKKTHSASFATGTDEYPYSSMWNHSTIGEQHGRLRITVPTMAYARYRLVRTFSW